MELTRPVFDHRWTVRDRSRHSFSPKDNFDNAAARDDKTGSWECHKDRVVRVNSPSTAHGLVILNQWNSDSAVDIYRIYGSYKGGAANSANPYVRRSKHGTDSMVISLGGIAPQGSLSPHTVGAHFLPKTIYEFI